METIEYSGQELALLLQDENGQQRCFMEARLRDPKVKVDISIDFTLQELAEHFVIPEVPDIAAIDLEGFNRNLKILEELEQVLAARMELHAAKACWREPQHGANIILVERA